MIQGFVNFLSPSTHSNSPNMYEDEYKIKIPTNPDEYHRMALPKGHGEHLSRRGWFEKNHNDITGNSIGITKVRDLPERDELPQDIQDFLSDLDGMSDLEKIQKIHAFVDEKMTYTNPGDAADPTLSLKNVLAKDGIGDCDDYVVQYVSLAVLAGIPTENVHFIIGVASNASSTSGHAAAVVNTNDQNYILDLNLTEPINLNELTPDFWYKFTPAATYSMKSGDPFYFYPDTMKKLMELSDQPSPQNTPEPEESASLIKNVLLPPT